MLTTLMSSEQSKKYLKVFSNSVFPPNMDIFRRKDPSIKDVMGFADFRTPPPIVPKMPRKKNVFQLSQTGPFSPSFNVTSFVSGPQVDYTSFSP